jgi:uncharacterized protein
MRRHAFIVPMIILHTAGLIFISSTTYASTSEEDSTVFRENLLPAQQGDAKAQVFVGYLYETGQGVNQDYIKAAEWYRRAAEKGNATAQMQLGNMYLYGRGLPQNFKFAYMWLDLAARQGNEQAMVSRAMIAKKMRRDQIRDAKRMAGVWRSKSK